MDNLSNNWITEKCIDFEYKKYILLAYLQSVEKKFEHNRLYPYLRDIILHYKNLIALKDNTDNLSGMFPQKIKSVDIENMMVAYEKIINDDSLMQELRNIIDFALPLFAQYAGEGKKIYDFIEERMHIYPVGIVPLYPDEGYMFLRDNSNRDTEIYQYHITLIEKDDDKYKGIHTTYIASYPKTIVNTMETIKSDLVKTKKDLPNPATYAIESELTLPVNETFLPIAKHVLVKFVGNNPHI
ncbi:MAG: hypothetical protein HYY40_14230 [Bacteroidetes bacterium]|nr:hypothetical protein [Bacteroidota bacterium]